MMGAGDMTGESVSGRSTVLLSDELLSVESVAVVSMTSLNACWMRTSEEKYVRVGITECMRGYYLRSVRKTSM